MKWSRLFSWRLSTFLLYLIFYSLIKIYSRYQYWVNPLKISTQHTWFLNAIICCLWMCGTGIPPLPIIKLSFCVAKKHCLLSILHPLITADSLWIAFFVDLLATTPKNFSWPLLSRKLFSADVENSAQSHLSRTREIVLGSVSVMAFSWRTGCSNLTKITLKYPTWYTYYYLKSSREEKWLKLMEMLLLPVFIRNDFSDLLI